MLLGLMPDSWIPWYFVFLIIIGLIAQISMG